MLLPLPDNFCMPNHKQKRGRKPHPKKRGLKRFAKAVSRIAKHPTVKSAVGHFADRAFSSLFGNGDYGTNHVNAGGGFKLAANTIVKGGSGPPLLNTHQDGNTRVRHREFLRDMQTTNAVLGLLTGFELCPTNSVVFPWLSALANRYEQWIPHGIVFEFISTCGSAISGTNAALGSVSMATQYNDVEAGFLNGPTKSKMLNHYFSSGGKTAESCMHAIECAPDETPYKVMYTKTDVPFGVTEDPRLTNLGYFSIFFIGSPGIYTAGELWVTYDITLLKPRLPVNLPDFTTVRQDFETLALRERAALAAAADNELPPPPPLELVRTKRVTQFAAPSSDDEVVDTVPPGLSASGFAGYVLGRSQAIPIPHR